MKPLFGYIFLAIAISSGIAANSFAKISEGFTKTVPVPALVNLEQVVEKIQPSQFNEPSKIFGILIEGEKLLSIVII